MSSSSPKSPADPVLRSAVDSIRQWCGIRVPEYRYPVIGTVLSRLGGERGLVGGTELLRRGDEAARDQILNAVTVPETYFFRHHGHFEILADFARRRRPRGCRVLSAGCSTGEEAWSAAAVLAFLPPPRQGSDEVVGWEIDSGSLRQGQEGQYRKWSTRGGFRGYESLFRETDGLWRVDPRLRETVRFGRVNLVDLDLVQERFDIVFFRNVSIYWEPETVQRVVAHLTRLLDDDGLLLIGPSDPVSLPATRWRHTIHRGARSYQRLDEAVAVADPVPRAPAPARRPRVLASRRRRAATAPGSRALGAPAVLRPRPSPVPPASVPERSEILADAEVVHDLIGEVRELADAGKSARALEVLRDHGRETPREKFWEGMLLFDLGDVASSVRIFRQCVFLEPEDPSLRRWLATAYEADGRGDDAAREHRNAQELERP